MPTRLNIRNGEIHSHFRVDHAEGDKARRFNRDLVSQGKKKDGNNPFNEAFSFTMEEFHLLKKLNPGLADSDPIARAKAWRDFANSGIGRHFRVR